GDLVRNKELARLVTDLELPVDVADCVIGEWDPEAVRRLFNALEFRTLLERLEDVERTAKAKVERASLEVRTGDTSEIAGLLTGSDPLAVAPLLAGTVRGLALSPAGGQALCAPTDAVPDPI